jgi:electron transport complex protein RnfD
MSQADMKTTGAGEPGGSSAAGLNGLKLVTSSPQIHHRDSTAKIMWTVTLCLAPAAAWGVWVFGPRSLLTLAASVLAAVVTEWAVGKAFFKRMTLRDGSAFLTGFLVGLNMPPAVPLYVPVVASVFAIAVVKWTFGGLGSNWMNPALAGRAFVFFSWTGEMTRWTVPATNAGLDAVSGATPLAFAKTGLIGYEGTARGPMQLIAENGYAWSATDGSVTSWLNETLLAPLGLRLDLGYVDLFLGNIPGSLGEVSSLLLLAGAAYLLFRKIITPMIPFVYLAVFGLLVWVFGGLSYGAGFLSGDVLFHLFTGGLMLGVFFMATDMVTSPLTAKGQAIYAAGAGFFTFLIRLYGSFPEGVSLAILLMNIFVPLINRYTGPVRFGVKRGRTAA